MKISMSARILGVIIVIFLFLLQIFSFSGDWKKNSIDIVVNNNANIQSKQQLSPQLLLRYEKGTSLFRLREDIFKLREVKEKEREKIAIRVCSMEKLLLSLPLAALNPFQTVEFLTKNLGYESANIIILRAANCISTSDNQLKATEIWTLSRDSELPSNDENYGYEQIKIVSLGFDPIDCNSSNYKAATKEIIDKMVRDKDSFGAIIGYYLENPNPSLKKRLKKIQSSLSKSKISKSRYLVALQKWHFGDSNCSNREPNQPAIIFITQINQK